MEQMEDCLDSDFVRSNLMNAAFCKFVYKYAGFASMTKREFKKKMSDPTSSAVKNLFEFLSPSDIAWAVLVYVSHEDLWKWEFQEYNKKKQVNIVHEDGDGQPIEYKPKLFHKGVVFGGFLFGAGWAITGACPGPIYAQIGGGEWMAVLTLGGALAGMFSYAALKPKLPH